MAFCWLGDDKRQWSFVSWSPHRAHPRLIVCRGLVKTINKIKVLGAVQRDVQQRHVSSGDVFPNKTVLCRRSWALETSCCGRALCHLLWPWLWVAKAPSASSPALWRKFLCWPCLELVQTWALRFHGEVSQRFMATIETELAGKPLQLELRRCPQQLSLEGDWHALPIPYPWFRIAARIIKQSKWLQALFYNLAMVSLFNLKHCAFSTAETLDTALCKIAYLLSWVLDHSWIPCAAVKADDSFCTELSF